MCVIKDSYEVGQIIYIDTISLLRIYFGLVYVLLVTAADGKIIRIVNT